MSYYEIILFLIISILSFYLFYYFTISKKRLDKFVPGSIWKLKNGEIIIIKEIGNPQIEYNIYTVDLNNVGVAPYNIFGNSRDNDPSRKMVDYLGKPKDFPEYFI